MNLVEFPGLGLELRIDRVAFTLFGYPIYYYGLCIALAVFLTLFLAYRQSSAFGLKKDYVLDVYLLMLPTVILGARLYYVLFSWSRYQDQPLWKILDIREGGLAFYGGVLAGALMLCCYARYRRLSVLGLLDFFVVYLPLGQAIGRWGNFFNQEAFGSNTELPWGMYSEATRQYLAGLQDPALNPALPVHPTFLYECLGNLLIFALLLYVRKRLRFRLETVAWYLLLYGFLRFFVESIRTDALFIGQTNIRVSMLLSGLMFLLAFAYLAFLHFFGARVSWLGKLAVADVHSLCLRERLIEPRSEEAELSCPAETASTSKVEEASMASEVEETSTVSQVEEEGKPS